MWGGKRGVSGLGVYRATAINNTSNKL